MGISRRDFFEISGSTVLLGSMDVNLNPAKAYAQGLGISKAPKRRIRSVHSVLSGVSSWSGAQ